MIAGRVISRTIFIPFYCVKSIIPLTYPLPPLNFFFAGGSSPPASTAVSSLSLKVNKAKPIA
ncbi:hypothetical protein BC937DRAFT_91358 [Endogone sp. FLAS-F59071]|nr:hypothetical protein BC937DRAFT_91358 [Endogone sp. FLAS-F59071]|eukprot:RUS21828.1 hypothetical protein BC937DRAFT_91358 [Endogone sp. FLAS-F59071]